jgi:hypothetical protein
VPSRTVDFLTPTGSATPPEAEGCGTIDSGAGAALSG